MILSASDGILAKPKRTARRAINCSRSTGSGDMTTNILFSFFIIIMLCISNKRRIFIG